MLALGSVSMHVCRYTKADCIPLGQAVEDARARLRAVHAEAEQQMAEVRTALGRVEQESADRDAELACAKEEVCSGIAA